MLVSWLPQRKCHHLSNNENWKQFPHSSIATLSFCLDQPQTCWLSLSLSLSLQRTLFLSLAHFLTYLMLRCAPNSQFRISMSSVRKSWPKTKWPRWLASLSGWMVQQGADLPTLFTTRLSNWRKRRDSTRENEKRERRDETRDLFGCAASSLRLFGAHNYCTTTGTRSRTYIIHIHRYLYWIFFPKFGFWWYPAGYTAIFELALKLETKLYGQPKAL